MIQYGIFFEDLSAMSVLELSEWLAGTHGLAMNGKEIDAEALETLYADFVEAMGITEETAEKYRPDDGERLLSNATIYRQKIFRKAVVAINRPRPQFFYQTLTAPPQDISNEVRNNPRGKKALASIITNGVDEYIASITDILEKPDYRRRLKDFIHDCRVKQTCFCYRLPTRKTRLEAIDIDTVISRLGRYKTDWDEAYTKQKLKQDKARGCEDERGLQESEAYGISRSVRARFFRGKAVDKLFFIRLAFFMGFENVLAETLLMHEGFSFSKSVRPADVIFYNSFRIGFSIEYADTLCKRKGLKGLL